MSARHSYSTTQLPKRGRSLCLVCCLIVSLGHGQVVDTCQENPIVSINIVQDVCAGDTLNISIGYRTTDNILLSQPESSHHETEKIFLPDGMSCLPYGTYYRSYANFNDFLPGAVINSANDIRYLRLKMEHSAIEDLRVTLVCPNDSSCKIIPDLYYDGWGTVPHNYFRVNLGLANRQTDQLSCDSTFNPIGVPWNYIWSSNTTQGYQYAGGTYGYVFEPANIHLRHNPYWDNSNGLGAYSYVIDSSNVSNMTQIYHPQQNFSSLVGCPLNGNWYIQVQDLQEQDNGYLVEWELAFDPSLLHIVQTDIVSRNLSGAWVDRLSDSTFLITPPATLTQDSLVHYTVLVVDSAGCNFDTTFTITFHPQHETHVYDTITQNQIPYIYLTHLFLADTPQDSQYLFSLTSTYGCDSLLYYHLHIIPNDTTYVQQAVCQSEIPYNWQGQLLTHAGTWQQTFTAQNGGDSIVFLALLINSADTTYLVDTLCQGESYMQFGFNLTSEETQSSGTFSALYSNIAGCDSLILLHLTIIPQTVGNITLDIHEGQLPYSIYGITFTHDTTNALINLTNIAGCDSMLYLTLIVHPHHQYTIDTLVCDYELPLIWNGIQIQEAGTTDIILQDRYGADSVLTLNLEVISTHIEIESLTEDFCDNMQTVLEVYTSMNEIIWNTGENLSQITVYSPGTYTVTGTQAHCQATAQHYIASCDFLLNLPNAITPGNGDGLNDYFCLPEAFSSQMANQSFSISILNRFGEVVFYSNDKHFQWDGTYKGRVIFSETYHYVIRYQNLFGKSSIIKGSIVVL